MKNVLIIRFSSLGDVVLTTALPPNIKAAWPDAEITFLTKPAFAPLYHRNPHLTHVWAFDPKKTSLLHLIREVRARRFDVVIDLHANLRSTLLRWFSGAAQKVTVEKATWARYKLLLFKRMSEPLRRSVRERILDTLKPLSIPRVSTETELYPPSHEEVLKKWDIPSHHRLVAVAPGARHATKRWPVVKFAEAANRLGAFPDTTVLLLGDKGDRVVATNVSERMVVSRRNVAGETSIDELSALLSKSFLLLTNDSGLLHMGEALKRPVTALFGPTVRGFGFAPYRSTSRVAEVGDLWCRPCTLHGQRACPLGHHHCMGELDVNAVLFAASSLIDDDDMVNELV